MDLIKKLEDLSVRFEEVQGLIADPELVKDQKKYKDVMREHRYLTELMELYAEYKKILSGIEEATVLITEEEDHDMKEMAREELKELEEKQPVLEEQIKLKLIPPASFSISGAKTAVSSVSVMPQIPEKSLLKEMSFSWFKSLKMLTLLNFVTPVMKTNCRYSS